MVEVCCLSRSSDFNSNCHLAPGKADQCLGFTWLHFISLARHIVLRCVESEQGLDVWREMKRKDCKVDILSSAEVYVCLDVVW